MIDWFKSRVRGALDVPVRSEFRSELSAAMTQIEARLSVIEQTSRGLAQTFVGDFYRRAEKQSMEEYWNRHNVTGHVSFHSADESLEHFHHRNRQYPGYIELLPVSGQDGMVILDFGCGPGNDLVGFSHFSRPARLIGIDMSKTSLAQAQIRLALHGSHAELLYLPYGNYEIPLDTASVDYLHCSGVLMLVEDPVRLLREFRRILKPGGEMRLMIYNFDSIWLHLYVAYVLQLENGLYSDVDVRSAFSRTTDGEDCPFVHVWSIADMQGLAAQSGFESEFLGAALSLWELNLLPRRFRAAMDQRLGEEHKDFLLSLEVDARGLPLYRGRYAGIDGCYRWRPA